VIGTALVFNARSSWLSRFALGLLLASPSAQLAVALNAPVASHEELAAAASTSSTISLSDYQTRLQSLDQLIATCQSAMTPANCQSSRVGPDVQVTLPSGPRQIRFGWLRSVLDQAAGFEAVHEKQEKAAKSQAAKPPSPSLPKSGQQPSAPTTEPPDYIPPTIAQRMIDARKRLAEDEQLIQPASSASERPGTSSTAQRATLTTILAAKEYQTAVAGRSLKQRILEKIGKWINKVIASLVQAGAKSKWIGVTAEIGFVLLICIALAWFLIRLEKQSRFAPASLGPGAGAASARDWQLWLQDAREAASHAAWRDAIHLLYWASISRLESSGLWPADRARTPREYLALLARENPQHPGLEVLTRSFERTWYGARPASEADFQQAEQLASQLTQKPGTQSRSKRGDGQGAR
jgi:hypothetical protein